MAKKFDVNKEIADVKARTSKKDFYQGIIWGTGIGVLLSLIINSIF